MILDTNTIAWDARDRVRLDNLSASAFVSDTDRAALENIQKIPLLPQILRKFNEMALDKISYARNSAESVRCGPNQFPTLHRMLRESCEILSITEPELYIHQSEVFNAYTSGTDRTFIVLHSALVRHFTDEELLFVIGHECGHIKAGHVLYQELGRMLMPLLEMLGQATLGLGQLAGIGLVAAFYEWMRQAEMSCDRAGLLVAQDSRVALSALMKLGGGSTRFDSEANLDAFLEQARNHSQMAGLEGLSKALLFVMYNWQLDHPQVIHRAKGLDEWEGSGAYAQILSGDFPRDMSGTYQMGQRIKCPKCKKMTSASVSFCPECGQDLHPERMATGSFLPCPRCGEKLAPGTKFCPKCGFATADAPPAGPAPANNGGQSPGAGLAGAAMQGVSSLWGAAKDVVKTTQAHVVPPQAHAVPPPQVYAVPPAPPVPVAPPVVAGPPPVIAPPTSDKSE